ncbi:MAG: PEGA domain-containing protein [Deltaproteobacteria bacterium]|nr:PEGA domain-containing protein [Deltaproteobacteria bacterium]
MLGRIACVAAAALFTVTGTAHAQPAGDIEMSDDPATPAAPPLPTKDPRTAKKHATTGQQAALKADAFAKRNKPDEAKAHYEIALAAYSKAAELGDDINVYFHLAGVEDKLGKPIDAVKHYRLVMRAASGVDPRIAKQVSARLEEVMSKIGTVALTITPDGTVVTLGGEQVGVSPLPEPLVLLPGAHTFVLTAPGFQPRETEIKVEAGSESERKIELESVTIVIEKPRKVEPDEADEVTALKGPSMLPVYISGGISLALIGTAIVTGLAAQSQHDTFVAADSTASQRSDAREVGKNYAHLTDVCIVGSLAAAGFGAYWYIFQYRPALKEKAMAEDEPRSSKVTMVPWVQPDTSGFAVVGSF